MGRIKTIINDMMIIMAAMVLGLGIQEMLLHFICLKYVVIICGYVFRGYSSSLEFITIMIAYIIIYISVWLISWWFGKRDEEIINQALIEIQDIE